jgi:hypothetical protein
VRASEAGALTNYLLCETGLTKVALYGLGNIRDERLHRTFKANKVKWFVTVLFVHHPAAVDDNTSIVLVL